MAAVYRELAMFSTRMDELMNAFFNPGLQQRWQKPTQHILIPDQVQEYYVPPANLGNQNRVPVQLQRAADDIIY